eukprot:COSAG01_NODE_2942_length_6815_cov_103.694312_10_plen_85_part_00
MLHPTRKPVGHDTDIFIFTITSRRQFFRDQKSLDNAIVRSFTTQNINTNFMTVNLQVITRNKPCRHMFLIRRLTLGTTEQCTVR